MTNDFTITSTECPNCVAANEALEAVAQRLDRIKAKARAAKKEIYVQWSCKAYDLYLEIMGKEE